MRRQNQTARRDRGFRSRSVVGHTLHKSHILLDVFIRAYSATSRRIEFTHTEFFPFPFNPPVTPTCYFHRLRFCRKTSMHRSFFFFFIIVSTYLYFPTICVERIITYVVANLYASQTRDGNHLDKSSPGVSNPSAYRSPLSSPLRFDTSGLRRIRVLLCAFLRAHARLRCAGFYRQTRRHLRTTVAETNISLWKYIPNRTSTRTSGDSSSF